MVVKLMDHNVFRSADKAKKEGKRKKESQLFLLSVNLNLLIVNYWKN